MFSAMSIANGSGIGSAHPQLDIWVELRWCLPQEARQLRDECHFERQRNIDPRNVDRLHIEQERGRFIEGTQIYICILPDGRMAIVNGNHTLEAVAVGTKPVLLSVCYKRVRNIDEAGAIYARFDLQKVRTWRDALQAHDVKDLLRNVQWTGAFSASVAHMLESFIKTGKGDIEITGSRDLRIDLMKDMQDLGDLYVTAVEATENKEKSIKRIMHRSGVMAVGLELFRYQATRAFEFFNGMAADDGLREGDPRKTLLRYLRNNATDNQNSRRIQSRAVALAWNAFFRGEEIQYVKPNAMGEFRLLGTPWKADFDPVATYLEPFREQQDEPLSFLRKASISGDRPELRS